MNTLLRVFATCSLFGIAYGNHAHLNNQQIEQLVGRAMQMAYLQDWLGKSELSPEDQTKIRRVQIVALGEMVYTLTSDLVFAQEVATKLSDRWDTLIEKRNVFNDIATSLLSAGAYFIQAATNSSREERNKAVSHALLCLAQLVGSAFQDDAIVEEETAKKIESVTYQMRNLILDDQVVDAMSYTLVGFANGIRVMAEQQRLQGSEEVQEDGIAAEEQAATAVA